jgi:hypothetical protein
MKVSVKFSCEKGKLCWMKETLIEVSWVVETFKE